MKLIVGLGNPGPKYRKTRHNIGYLVLSELAGEFASGKPKNKFYADTLDAVIGGQSVLLVCPTTFMNRSGLSVREAAKFYKIPNEEILVVCDDLNLPFARLRIRSEGGSGGQKGLQDIITHLGDTIPRLRFGIGDPPGNMDAADYVLANFTEKECKELPLELKRAAEAIETWVVSGIEETMNRFNSK